VSLHLLRYKTFFIMKCLQTNCIVQSLRQLNIRRNIRRVLRYVKHEFSEIHLHIEIFYVIKLKPLIRKIQNIRRRAYGAPPSNLPVTPLHKMFLLHINIKSYYILKIKLTASSPKCV